MGAVHGESPRQGSGRGFGWVVVVVVLLASVGFAKQEGEVP